MVGLFLQSGYALLPSQPNHRVSSRLTLSLTRFVARQRVLPAQLGQGDRRTDGATKGQGRAGAQLAVTLHAMWRTNTPFREAAMA